MTEAASKRWSIMCTGHGSDWWLVDRVARKMWWIGGGPGGMKVAQIRARLLNKVPR